MPKNRLKFASTCGMPSGVGRVVRHCGKNADDRNHDHQFDEGETFLNLLDHLNLQEVEDVPSGISTDATIAADASYIAGFVPA